MLIDASRFPLVFMRTNVSSTTSAVEQLEALLDRGERFALLTDHSPAEEHRETAEERRERALFFKRNKLRLRKYCVAAIVIEGGKATPPPLRLAAQAFGKSFGFGFHFVPTDTEAAGLALQLLAQSGGSLSKNS